jgi:hypothetical protein
MASEDTWTRLGLDRAWAREMLWAAAALALGFGLMPLLIFAAGSVTLGRYEGAAPQHLYGSIYSGLVSGGVASWVVVLGPYGLYLLFRAILFAWRAGSSSEAADR